MNEKMPNSFESQVATSEKKLKKEISKLNDQQLKERLKDIQEKYNEDPDNYETVLERDLLLKKLSENNREN